MGKSLTISPRYKKFVDERNKALEYILDRHLTEVDNEVDVLKTTIHMMSQYFLRNNTSDMAMIIQGLKPSFSETANNLTLEAMALRRVSFGLSYLSEAEAIGRAIWKPHRVDFSKHKVQQVLEKPFRSGAHIDDRMRLALNRLLRNVVDAIEDSVIHRENPDYLEHRIEMAFPKKRKLVYPKTVMAKPKSRHMREADKLSDDDFLATGFIDDDSWQEIVDDYLAANIPTTRGPEDVVKIKSKSGKTKERYAWEVEQEMTQDFLDNVRAGQVDAATENGITDFQWIAIIDQKTDDCCAWRDGLTSSEIRDELNGDHKGDDCDAEVPPAHFNCRCNVAPMSDKMPDEPPPDLGDFDTWLTS